MSSSMFTAGARVAMVAGGLSRGGAEKQFVYMARALRDHGVEVRCYCLTTGDVYEQAIRDLGVPLEWIGQHGAPPFRVAALARRLRAFRPDIVQAGHFFANLYAVLGARTCGALSIGAIRNDGAFELRENPGWGPWLLRWPTLIIANSQAGARHAQAHGRTPDNVRVVPNVIDLQAFDAVTTTTDLRGPARGPVAVAVGRLVRAKRFDRFIEALALARRTAPDLSAVVIGDGPERAALEQVAAAHGVSDAVRFLGGHGDVPALMRQADLLVSTSEHEGFPNVLLEAQAASLPVVATDAGDASVVLLPGATGFVTNVDDVAAVADRMAMLARTPATRRAMGAAARRRVEQLYQPGTLARHLCAAYSDAAALRPGWRQPSAPSRPVRVAGEVTPR